MSPRLGKPSILRSAVDPTWATRNRTEEGGPSSRGAAMSTARSPMSVLAIKGYASMASAEGLVPPGLAAGRVMSASAKLPMPKRAVGPSKAKSRTVTPSM